MFINTNDEMISTEHNALTILYDSLQCLHMPSAQCNVYKRTTKTRTEGIQFVHQTGQH
jgi:hypothetical protein